MTACATPLVDLLRSVPHDARLVVDGEDGLSTRYIPIGRLATEAADALSRATDEEGLARVLHEAECRIAGYDVPWDAEVESEREQARTIARAIIDHIKGEKKDG